MMYKYNFSEFFFNHNLAWKEMLINISTYGIKNSIPVCASIGIITTLLSARSNL
jgi:hypothetical protein